MRLKQLLGILTLLMVVTVTAAAAGSQLTSVNAAAKGTVTTVTLQASGTFTHNEYRPTDDLLLVDLTGVSAANLREKERALAMPGVKSYRVLSYKGASGTEVTRLEIALSDATDVKVSESKGGLNVMVTGKEMAKAAVAAPEPSAPKTATAEPAKPKAVAAEPVKTAAPASSATATIRNVAVVRGKSGMEIEIDGVTTAKAMKLSGPDRIVLDANAVPAVRNKNIFVNSPDLKAVRIARYQLEPPVTRIVLDLKEAREFEVVPGTNRITVKLQAPVVAQAVTEKPAVAKAETKTEPKPQPAPAPAKETVQAKAEPAAEKPQLTPVKNNLPPTQAQPAVFVEADNAPKMPKPADPSVRAAEAATTMAKANTTENPMPPVSGSISPKPAVNLALEQQQQMEAAKSAQSQGPHYTGEPISVNLKDVDLKDFFRLIHDISGLNVVLDPNVRGSVTLVLDDVPWDQALDIVLQNNGLDRQLQGNVLRIATVDTLRREAEARRTAAEAQAAAVDKQTVTRFLSYAHAKDVMPTVKRFLSQRGDVIADERLNALIIQDIPSVIPEVDRLLAQLDRKTQEVEIEARVVAATRRFAREIGFQLGFGWGNGTSAVGGAGSAGSSPLTVAVPGAQYFLTGAPNATLGNPIPLFSNFPSVNTTSGLSFSNATKAYRLDAVLTMAEQKGLLKILSRPRVVTQSNITAIVKQGFRLPVVTQAQLGGPPTVTFVEALLRLTVTPQITAENTIFMAIDVENTTPDKANAVQGNPALLTQQAQTQVLVTDGGTVVIGGVIQTQNSVNVQQVPLLGDIPILGNLFKHRGVDTVTQELIFFITPKIIET